MKILGLALALIVAFSPGGAEVLNDKALDLLRRIFPAAWQHLHFLGHYAFRDERNPIDLGAVLAGIDWE